MALIGMAMLEEMDTVGVGTDGAKAGRLWRPRRVLITPEAYGLERGRRMLERVAGFGADVVRLASNRLTGFSGETMGKSYALAKTTLAIVVRRRGRENCSRFRRRRTGSFILRRDVRRIASTATWRGR